MIPVVGFAAAAAKGGAAWLTPGVVKAAIGAVGAVGGQCIARQAALQAGRMAIGAAVAPAAANVLLAAGVAYAGYKFFSQQSDKG